MDAPGSIRIDKWLWAVRLYKTRSLAAEACTAGKVTVGDQPVKPARSVRIGEVISAVTGDITRTVKVIGLVSKRVGAKLVAENLEDLTPPSEFEKKREPNFQPFAFRPKGSGRPTKKDRRSIDNLEE